MPKFIKILSPKRYTTLLAPKTAEKIDNYAKLYGMYEGQVVRLFVERHCETLEDLPKEVKTPVAKALKSRTKPVRAPLGKV